MGNGGNRSGLHETLQAIMARLDAQEQFITAIASGQRVDHAQLTYLASVAGVTPQMQAIARKVQADINNPAQPVAEPAGEPAVYTTEQAATPEAYDNPQAPGATPGSTQHLHPDTVDFPLRPGESLPSGPFNTLEDVTAPVDGTQGQRPIQETRIETDVRVGDPMNPEVAYPLNGQQRAASREDGTARFANSMKLAKLRIEAGLDNSGGDEFAVAASIESSPMTVEAMQHEISTIAAMTQRTASQAQRPRNLVPRVANASGERTAPSMVSTASVASTDDSDLFEIHFAE